MKQIKDDKLSILHSAYLFQGQHRLALSVLSGFSLDQPPKLLDDGDLWDAVTSALGRKGAFDLAMPKGQAELIVAGKAHSPGGAAVRHLEVSIRVGAMHKSIAVFGDRYWKKSAAPIAALSDPQPFSEMELSWENAFGGPDFRSNPDGKGILPIKLPSGHQRVPLPNLEDPAALMKSPSDRPPPAAFCPLGLDWPLRMSYAGTYDENWRQNIFPGFPDDFDLGYFNVAPFDQRFDGSWEGNEFVEISNMHPEKPQIKSHLPGIRVRCFLNRQINVGAQRVADPSVAAPIQLEEIFTQLETIWLFPNQNLGATIWRASVPIADDEASEISHLLAFYELQNQERQPISYYHKKLEEESAPATAVAVPSEAGAGAAQPIPALSTGTLSAAAMAAVRLAALAAAMPTGKKSGAEPSQPEAAQLESSAPDATGLAAAPAEPGQAATPATPPESLSAAGKPAEPPPKQAAAPAASASAGMKDLSVADRARAMKMQAEKSHQQLKSHLARFGIDIPSEAPVQQPSLPPRERPPDTSQMADQAADTASLPLVQRINLLKQQARETRQQQENFLKQHKLPTPEETAATSLKKAERKAATVPDKAAYKIVEDLKKHGIDHQELFNALYLTEAKIKRAERAIADLRALGKRKEPIAPKPTAARSGEPAEKEPPSKGQVQAQVSGGASLAGADLSGCDLTDMDFSGQDLQGCNLSGAVLEKSNLSGVNLSGVLLVGAILTGAIFAGARLKGAKMSEASASKCNFVGADLTGADFAKADLQEADFTDADLRQADLSEANLAEAVFKKAKCSQAKAVNSQFVKADLSGADFQGCDLCAADLSGAKLEKTDFTKALLTDVCFAEATGTAPIFASADLKRSRTDGGTKMDKADFSDANLADSNWQDSAFPDANFARADLSGSHISQCDLSRANMERVIAPQADFTKCNLNQASLLQVNLFQGCLSKANLSQANLQGSNLFGVDFTQAIIQDANFEGANLKRTILAE